MSPAASSRWCPTPEQLVVLEELYRNGVRTPKASQIQRITAHLSLYGKIEGKNVFYWFQNHKARERQRLRRKLIKQLQFQHFYHPLNCDAFLPRCDWYSSSSWANRAHNHLGFKCGGTGRETVNEEWKVEIPGNTHVGNSMMRTYGCDWMMKVSPSNSTKPLETLQLFPIRSTDFKHE